MLELLSRLVFRTDTPVFDGDAARNALLPYMTEIRNFLLWFVPLAFVVASLVAGIGYFFMDEMEREQKPITKTITKLAIGALVVYSVPLIASIIGLA